MVQRTGQPKRATKRHKGHILEDKARRQRLPILHCTLGRYCRGGPPWPPPALKELQVGRPRRTALQSSSRLYVLHLGGGHEQIVDSIKVVRIEEVDFDLASATLSLKYFDLRAQRSAKLAFSGAYIWIDDLRSPRIFRRLLLRCLVNQKLCGSNG